MPNPDPCFAVPLKIYINGELVDKENAKISVYDHGLLYGDGVFEGMRSYGGKVFRLEQHLVRLWNSAKAIWLEIPISKEAMATAVNDTLTANAIQDGYIRLVVTRGAGTLGLDPNRCSHPQVIIITDKIELYPEELLPQRAGNRHRQHNAESSRRVEPAHQIAELSEQYSGKNRGLEGRLHRGADAQSEGGSRRVPRAIICSSCAAAFCKRRPWTPEFWRASPAMPSSSWPVAAGIEVREMPLTRHDVYIAEECFLTGTRRGSDSGGENRQPTHRRRQARSPHARSDGTVPETDAGLSKFGWQRSAISIAAALANGMTAFDCKRLEIAEGQ